MEYMNYRCPHQLLTAFSRDVLGIDFWLVTPALTLHNFVDDLAAYIIHKYYDPNQDDDGNDRKSEQGYILPVVPERRRTVSPTGGVRSRLLAQDPIFSRFLRRNTNFPSKKPNSYDGSDTRSSSVSSTSSRGRASHTGDGSWNQSTPSLTIHTSITTNGNGNGNVNGNGKPFTPSPPDHSQAWTSPHQKHFSRITNGEQNGSPPVQSPSWTAAHQEHFARIAKEEHMRALSPSSPDKQNFIIKAPSPSCPIETDVRKLTPVHTNRAGKHILKQDPETKQLYACIPVVPPETFYRDVAMSACDHCTCLPARILQCRRLCAYHILHATRGRGPGFYERAALAELDAMGVGLSVGEDGHGPGGAERWRWDAEDVAGFLDALSCKMRYLALLRRTVPDRSMEARRVGVIGDWRERDIDTGRGRGEEELIIATRPGAPVVVNGTRRDMRVPVVQPTVVMGGRLYHDWMACHRPVTRGG